MSTSYKSPVRRMTRPAIASLLILAATASPYCLAEDGKVYPAAMCQGSLVGSPPITSYTGNRLVNNSTTNSAVVVCPMVKDNVFAATGGNEGYVRYFKGTATGIIANLYSYSAFGTASFTQFRSDFAAATGNRTLSYTPIGGFAQGFTSFIVVLPPGPAAASKSALLSYRFDEND
jgi:hypothetical protein